MAGLPGDGVAGHDADGQRQEQRHGNDQGRHPDEQPVLGDAVQERRPPARRDR